MKQLLAENLAEYSSGIPFNQEPLLGESAVGHFGRSVGRRVDCATMRRDATRRDVTRQTGRSTPGWLR